MSKISVIGCGRWGSFLAHYSAENCKHDVKLYGRKNSVKFQELQSSGKNKYLTLSKNVELINNLEKALKSEIIIISIGCQNLRDLSRQINSFNVQGKAFLLCMKGMENGTGKRLSQVVEEEIKQDIKVAVWLGPGHVQYYMKNIPNCTVMDSEDSELTKNLVDKFDSKLIRFYYGNDLIGNEIGAAMKNVMGIAAGMLDGLGFTSLKGALMARGAREVARYIKVMGGKELSAYGLAHLGDYEATLFSEHSHNRKFGESFARGEKFDKLAEGVETIKAVKQIVDSSNINMPISTALYSIIFENKDPKQIILGLFEREVKKEFI